MKNGKSWIKEHMRKMACVLAAALILQTAAFGMQAVPGILSEGAEIFWQRIAGSGQPALAAENIATGSDAEEKEEHSGYGKEEEDISPKATPSEARPSEKEKQSSEIMPARMELGGENLWNGWNGKMEFPGEGTAEAPYQIGSLALLMGLSQAVAEGETFEGTFFELTRSLDLGGLNINSGNWNPIGWYLSSDQMGGEVETPFKGTFDGCGNTIQGLKIVQSDEGLTQLGLFGVIDGGTVKNLRIKAEEICGTDSIGILAGTITGDAVIYNVTVSGRVIAESSGHETVGGMQRELSGNAGGIAGTVDGRDGQATIENCKADGVTVRSDNEKSGTGGIAGALCRGDLADNTVKTGDSTYERISGAGYVGGIVGIMEDASIYNSLVEGTVGGNGSQAAGGIVGRYESGNLAVARFAGDIGRTNQGASAREGTFIGTRGSIPFSYGTEAGDNLAYLFTDTAEKAKQATGSDMDGDNSFTKSAHIGYWLDNQQTYALVSRTTEFGDDSRFFYEELEDGIRFIVTVKLQNEFTSAGMAEGLAFRLDHFAPGAQGQPVRGYLLSVPRIDARNANGTYDTDVASLTAMPEGNRSYYRAIDKNHPAAVAPGMTVSVVTAPKNNGANRYQMAVDTAEQGSVKAPVYINAAGRQVPMTYVSGGTYTFRMPERDTEINAEYVKVTTVLTMTPQEMKISVVQTRSGDRKNPNIVTEVRSQDGVLIARYIDNQLDTAVQVQPVAIHGEHNVTGETADRTVRWSVDDTDLLNLEAEAGYTEGDARILPNLSGSFIQGIISRETKAQSDSQYQEPISPVIYEKKAVVTAASNPDTSADHQAVYGNCKVTVTFQIVDQTTRRVEGLQMNYSDITITITRKLTGYRLNPAETITCSGPAVLAAQLYPERPFYKNVTWKDQGNGTSLVLAPGGANSAQCTVTARYDEKGQDNPAWIQNVIYEDNRKRQEDPYAVLNGSAVYQETVTATSEDQTHGVVSADCRVTVRFETKDDTVLSLYSGGSGGGGSSGSGGGSSGSGKSAGISAAPSGSVAGTWTQEPDGNWTFAVSGQIYRSRWAYIYNPYADTAKGQQPADWFYFDENGHMTTGWKWIAGSDGKSRCYYLNERQDGTKGAMYHDGITPDGYQVNHDGAWTVNGVVQIK